MFGLSKKERLVKAIKNACVAKLYIYENSIALFLKVVEDTSPPSCDEVASEALYNRKRYLNAVSDLVLEPLHDSPSLKARLTLAYYDPSITGLPDRFDLDYLSESGTSAGVLFALCYFCLTNKPIKESDMKTLSELNHYQNNLMELVIKKYM